jgi:hypothetical protein
LWPIASVDAVQLHVGSLGQTGSLQPSAKSTLVTLTGRAANIPKLTRMSGDVTFLRLPKDGTA